MGACDVRQGRGGEKGVTGGADGQKRFITLTFSSLCIPTPYGDQDFHT